MTPRTQLGRVLLTGGNDKADPKDACRSVEELDRTVALFRACVRELEPAERQDVTEIAAVLAGRRRG